MKGKLSEFDKAFNNWKLSVEGIFIGFRESDLKKIFEAGYDEGRQFGYSECLSDYRKEIRMGSRIDGL